MLSNVPKRTSAETLKPLPNQQKSKENQRMQEVEKKRENKDKPQNKSPTILKSFIPLSYISKSSRRSSKTTDLKLSKTSKGNGYKAG